MDMSGFIRPIVKVVIEPGSLVDVKIDSISLMAWYNNQSPSDVV